MVAAVFAYLAGSLALLPALLCVGIPAVLVNFKLFRSDSYTTLKELVFGRLLKDKNGKPISRTKKYLVGIAFFFCVAAGASFFFVSASSAITVFTFVFSFTVLPHMVVVAAACSVAAVTGMSLVTLFYVAVSNVIKSDSCKTYFANLKESYQSVKDISSAGKFIGYALLLPVVVGVLTLAVTLSSAGLFIKKATTTLLSVFGLSTPVAVLAANIIILVAVPVNGYFYGAKIVDLFVMGVNGAKSVVNLIKTVPQKIVSAVNYVANSVSTKVHGAVSFIKNIFTRKKRESEGLISEGEVAVADLEETVEEKAPNLIRQRAVFWSRVSSFTLFACAGANGYGQGAGLEEKSALSLMPVPSNVATPVSVTAMNLTSDGANMNAIRESNAIPEPVSLTGCDFGLFKPVPNNGSVPANSFGSNNHSLGEKPRESNSPIDVRDPDIQKVVVS